jgi:hypothetical protein
LVLDVSDKAHDHQSKGVLMESAQNVFAIMPKQKHGVSNLRLCQEIALARKSLLPSLWSAKLVDERPSSPSLCHSLGNVEVMH